MSADPLNKKKLSAWEIALISLPFALYIAWWIVAHVWGSVSVGGQQGSNAWSPNLLGDSFGAYTALLTAAAFIGVVLTYRKERDALVLLTTESNARKNDDKKAILDRQLTSVIAMFRENREAFARYTSGSLAPRFLSQRFVIEDNLGLYFLPLDTWCKLADSGDSPFDEYEKTVYAEILDSLLNEEERMVITGQDIEAFAKDGTKHQYAVFIFKYKHKVDFTTL